MTKIAYALAVPVFAALISASPAAALTYYIDLRLTEYAEAYTTDSSGTLTRADYAGGVISVTGSITTSNRPLNSQPSVRLDQSDITYPWT